MIFYRIKAAFIAYRNPVILYNGIELQKIISKLEVQRDFCLLTGKRYHGTIFPKFEMLLVSTQYCIKNNCMVNI